MEHRAPGPSRSWRCLLRLLLAVCVIPAAAEQVCGAQILQSGLDERQVKAAFVYNFLKFVQWPDDRTTAFVLGIVGDDDLVTVLEQITRDKTIQGRTPVVRKIKSTDDVLSCEVVFVTASEDRRTPHILQRLEGASVLTIGETPHFLGEGGIIRFYVEGSRLRFQINAENANRAGLKISSQLLSLAR